MKDTAKERLQKSLEKRNSEKLKRLITTDIPSRSNWKNLSGNKVNKLYIDHYVGMTDSNEHLYYCICDCGNVLIARGVYVISGKIKSCGCIGMEKRSKIMTEYNKNRTYEERTKLHLTHGESKTRLYKIWVGIKTRLFNPNATHYEYYGGKNLNMYEEWIPPNSGFVKFKEWAIDNGYDDTKTIDRIDNSKGYYPDNCRWITQKDQLYNTTRSVFIKYDKYNYPASIWSKITGIEPGVICRRYYDGKDIKDVLFCKNVHSINKEYIDFDKEKADSFIQYNKEEG